MTKTLMLFPSKALRFIFSVMLGTAALPSSQHMVNVLGNAAFMQKQIAMLSESKGTWDMFLVLKIQ